MPVDGPHLKDMVALHKLSAPEDIQSLQVRWNSEKQRYVHGDPKRDSVMSRMVNLVGLLEDTKRTDPKWKSTGCEVDSFEEQQDMLGPPQRSRCP